MKQTPWAWLSPRTWIRRWRLRRRLNAIAATVAAYRRTHA